MLIRSVDLNIQVCVAMIALLRINKQNSSLYISLLWVQLHPRDGSALTKSASNPIAECCTLCRTKVLALQGPLNCQLLTCKTDIAMWSKNFLNYLRKYLKIGRFHQTCEYEFPAAFENPAKGLEPRQLFPVRRPASSVQHPSSQTWSFQSAITWQASEDLLLGFLF